MFDLSNAEDPFRARSLLGLVGEEAYDLAVAEGYAYVAGGLFPPQLWVLDVSDPLEPRRVSAYSAFGGNRAVGQAVAVAGSHAYLSAGLGGSRLQILDLSDRAQPRLLAQYQGAIHEGGSLLPTAGALFHLTNEIGRGFVLRILDVSDPRLPAALGSYLLGQFPHRSATGLRMADTEGYLYVATDVGGLSVIDVSDQRSPVLVWSGCL